MLVTRMIQGVKVQVEVSMIGRGGVEGRVEAVKMVVLTIRGVCRGGGLRILGWRARVEAGE